jgi:hypothetical protein
LAARIAHDLKLQPSRFAELALHHSDDEPSKEFGGYLGGLKATNLLPWPRVLQAVACLRFGETSAVVETNTGFHIFRLESPPPEELVSGSRIVIQYAGAGRVGKPAAAISPKTRTRKEAMQVALALVAELRATPDRFDMLAEQYSEPDVQSGDLGVWSTREPTHLPREMAVLSELSVGEISKAFDSRFGVEILKRTQVEERERFAMTHVRFRFDPSRRAPDPLSRDATLARVETALARIRNDPKAFEELQKELCCVGVESWTKGREPPGLRGVIDGLQEGEVASVPVNVAPFLMIVKRVRALNDTPRQPETLFQISHAQCQ